MKKTIEQVIFAILFVIGGICQVSCNQKVAKEQVESQVAEKESTCLTAVDDYLINEFGKHYVQGDVCIPCAYVIDKDESNADDILVWGDFWVFNYKLSGDTLKTVSGGAHPGLMHVQKTDDGFKVTGFDAVVDGSGNLESAKKIFGEKFPAYQAVSSDDKKREENRARIVAEYVKENNLSATMYQDEGWPVVNLPHE